MTKKKAEAIVDKSMKALGINMEMKTDVKILQEILSEIKLNDFETTYAPMKRFFKEAVSVPQDLKPMLTNIKQGLIKKHPAVLEFAEKALHEGWFVKSEYVQKSVHVAFVLEAMTVAMCNSNIFFIEAHNHIRKKELEIGIDNRHIFKTIWRSWPRSANFFASAKAISIDTAMVYFRFRRELGGAPIAEEKIKKLHKQGKISYLEYKFLLLTCKKKTCHCGDWLRINIYEAGVTEYNNGFKSNAISAHALSEYAKKNCHQEVFKLKIVLPEGDIDKFYEPLTKEKNYFPTFTFDQDWVSLYETWNMAFILGELNNLHFLFPKLFIPSVLNAKSENFLGTRIISLWLAVNNAVFISFNNFEEITGPVNRRKMAQAWGEINRKYAFKLSEEHIQEDSKALKKSFNNRFTRPFYNLAKLFVGFLD